MCDYLCEKENIFYFGVFKLRHYLGYGYTGCSFVKAADYTNISSSINLNLKKLSTIRYNLKNCKLKKAVILSKIFFPCQKAGAYFQYVGNNYATFQLNILY